MYTEIRIIRNQPVANRAENIIKFITLLHQTILPYLFEWGGYSTGFTETGES